MKTLRYEIVDVFTDRPFAGNPLAVVLDADHLDSDQMQAIAREFNLSETTFVLPPGPGADYRIRIFTPSRELPFAGHPSVGTAITLARLGLLNTGDVIQECGAGQLPVTVYDGRAMLTGGAPTVGPETDPASLLAAVGLTAADHVGPPPRLAGCGISFWYLSVRPDAVTKVRPDSVLLGEYDVVGVSVFSWDADRRVAHTRMFAPGAGVAEDPATGSAALGFGVWLVASKLVGGDATTDYTVHQGAEIHRPSTMDCTVTAAAGQVTRTTVAGSAIPVARGEITVPPFIG